MEAIDKKHHCTEVKRMERIENKVDYIASAMGQVQVAVARLEATSETRTQTLFDNLKRQDEIIRTQRQDIDTLLRDSYAAKEFATRKQVNIAYFISLLGLVLNVLFYFLSRS